MLLTEKVRVDVPGHLELILPLEGCYVLIKTLYTVKFLLAGGGCPEVACNILLIHEQGRMDMEVSPPPGFSC